MRERLSRLLLFAVLALLATLPLHAEVQPSSSAASTAKLDARYCQTAGCLMQGDLRLSTSNNATLTTPGQGHVLSIEAPGSSSNTLRLVGSSASGAGRVGMTFTTPGNTPGSYIAAFLDSSATVLRVGVDGALSNPSTDNGGRVTIDDDAEVTGTLTAGTFARDTDVPNTSVAFTFRDLASPILEVKGGGALQNPGPNHGGAVRVDDALSVSGDVLATSVTTSLVTRASNDLSLSTTTSGDVVLSPAGSVVVGGPMRASVQTLVIPDNGTPDTRAGPATGDLDTETGITTPTASVLVVDCQDDDGCNVLLANPTSAGELLTVVDAGLDGSGMGHVYMQVSSAFYSAGDPDAGFLAVNGAASLVSYEHTTLGTLQRAWTQPMGDM